MSSLKENQQIVDKLNQLLRLDKEFITKIINTRYSVNQNYVESSAICTADESGNDCSGTLGLINTLLVNDKYRISANYDDNMVLCGFSLLKWENGKLIVDI